MQTIEFYNQFASQTAAIIDIVDQQTMDLKQKVESVGDSICNKVECAGDLVEEFQEVTKEILQKSNKIIDSIAEKR